MTVRDIITATGLDIDETIAEKLNGCIKKVKDGLKKIISGVEKFKSAAIQSPGVSGLTVAVAEIKNIAEKFNENNNVLVRQENKPENNALSFNSPAALILNETPPANAGEKFSPRQFAAPFQAIVNNLQSLRHVLKPVIQQPAPAGNGVSTAGTSPAPYGKPGKSGLQNISVENGLRLADNSEIRNISGIIGLISGKCGTGAGEVHKNINQTRDNIKLYLSVSFGLIKDISGGLLRFNENIKKPVGRGLTSAGNGVSTAGASPAPYGKPGKSGLQNTAVTSVTGAFTADCEKVFGDIKVISNKLNDAVGSTAEGLRHIVSGAADGALGMIKDFFYKDAGFAKSTENTADTFVSYDKEYPELIVGGKDSKVFAASKTGGIIGVICDVASTAKSTVKAAEGVITQAKAVVAELVSARNEGKREVYPYQTKTDGFIAGLIRHDQGKVNITMNEAHGSSGGGIAEELKYIGGLISGGMKFVAGKAAGAKANADSYGTADTLRSIVGDILSFAQGASVSPGTVQSMVSNTTNKSVTQNNYFESTFNGDRAGQKQSSEAMKKSAGDATGELARALAFAR